MMLWLSRQTVNELLRYLEQEEIIHCRRGGVRVLDPSRLRDAAPGGIAKRGLRALQRASLRESGLTIQAQKILLSVDFETLHGGVHFMPVLRIAQQRGDAPHRYRIEITATDIPNRSGRCHFPAHWPRPTPY